MKEWFKYEFGFVNVDSENLYLTNTGNWSETKNLTEKNKKVSNKNDRKSSSITGFIILVFCVFAFMIYKIYISGKLGISLILLTVGGGYKFYQYLKTEIGAKFKIPLEKITELNINEKSAEIKFVDGESLSGSYLLNNIDEKGKQIIKSLKETKR